MKANDFIAQILKKESLEPKKNFGAAFAPANVALCKYWGKRAVELNLPMTSSLSVSLGDKGTKTKLSFIDAKKDQIILNGSLAEIEHPFYQRTKGYLDYFRPKGAVFLVETENSVPTGAGLASSASGFAALVLALADLYEWQLARKQLSLLARLGSGSAARSLWHGFVKWHANDDPFLSYAEKIDIDWEDLAIGLLICEEKAKPISSREAMNRTVETSPFYKSWPEIVLNDMTALEQAILTKDFETLGKVSESNALAMHATMQTAWPPIYYTLPTTLEMMHQVWAARSEGLLVYFTQDAGPNLKLIFLKNDLYHIHAIFNSVKVALPFRCNANSQRGEGL